MGMRILMISDHSDPLAHLGGEEAGGQNVYVDKLSTQIAESGHTVHVLTRQNRLDAPAEQEAPGGYKVFRVPVGPPGFLPKEEFAKHMPDFVRAAKALFQKHDYDIIHANYWLSGVCALALRSAFGVPVVQTFHSLGKMKHAALKGIDDEHQRTRERAERSIIEGVDKLVAESPEERRILISQYKADAKRIEIIPAGVDTSVFRPGQKSAARRSLNITAAYVILYVGRFVAQKGLPTLLMAYAQMRQECTEDERRKTILLLIGGDGANAQAKESKQMKRVRSLISNLDLQDAVRLVGKVENAGLPMYYHAADICVVPSKYEPFGIVPLEAMACRTPVVASHVGGMKSTVRHLHNGFHARPESSADFAYKMRLLIQNPRMRRDFGHQAYRDVIQQYNWQSVSDKMLACYVSTIADHEDR